MMIFPFIHIQYWHIHVSMFSIWKPHSRRTEVHVSISCRIHYWVFCFKIEMAVQSAFWQSLKIINSDVFIFKISTYDHVSGFICFTPYNCFIWIACFNTPSAAKKEQSYFFNPFIFYLWRKTRMLWETVWYFSCNIYVRITRLHKFT